MSTNTVEMALDVLRQPRRRLPARAGDRLALGLRHPEPAPFPALGLRLLDLPAPLLALVLRRPGPAAPLVLRLAALRVAVISYRPIQLWTRMTKLTQLWLVMVTAALLPREPARRH